jgi:hypothetical protein
MPVLASVAMTMGQAHSAAAEQIPPMYVFSERQNGDDIKCQIDNALSVAAAEAELRFNHVAISTKANAAASKALYLYINTNAIDMGPVCAANLSVQIFTSDLVRNPVTKVTGFTELHYCDESGIIAGPSYDLQDRIGTKVKSLVDACLSKY